MWIEGNNHIFETETGTKNTDLEKKLFEKEQSFLLKYNVAKQQLEDLYTFSANKRVEELRSELLQIAQKQENISATEVSSSLWELLLLREQVRKSIYELKSEIQEWMIESYFQVDTMLSSRFVSPRVLEQCKNPQNWKDHTIWLSVWAMESMLWSGKLVYDVTLWVFKLPVDIYKIVSKKWEYDGFKKI